MEFNLKEMKRLTQFARRAGIKSIKVEGLELVFHDAVVFPQRRKPRLVQPDAGISRPAPPPEPTLDQINEYIYGNTEDTA